MKGHLAPVTRYWLLVILVGFVALALIYSATVPLFEGPDEIWHYAFANHLANGGGLPVFDVHQPATFLRNGAHPPLYYALIAALIAPIERDDFPAEYRFNLASPKITESASGTAPNLLIHTAREDFPYRDTALAGHLARLVSIALGALTVVGVFCVARRLLRDERLALIATALVAFIPQFVYGTALINNDALAALSATWLLYTLLRWMDDQGWRWAALSGVFLGITLLSKIGMIVVLPIPALALVTPYGIRKRQGPRLVTRYALLHSLAGGVVIYGLALFIAGWWYTRNFTLYGDPLMWREWQVLTGTGRVPPTPIDFLHDMLGFFGLFWADFSLRIDRALWPLFGLIVIAVVAGLIRRAVKREWPALNRAGLLIALAWLGLLFASAVRYSFNIYDIHGRLLYPALAPIGVILALGLSGWPRSKWVIGSVLTILMGLAVLAPFAIIQTAYARPIVPSLPDDATKTSARFGDVELVGYHLKSDRVKAGEPIEVETYWQTATPTAGERYVTLTLLQPDGMVLGQTEVLLGTDAYPSFVWQPDEMVATKLNVKTPVDLKATVVTHVRMALRSSEGESLNIGQVAITARRSCEIDRAADVTFGGSIKLIGYRIEESSTVGVAPRIVLCWESLRPVPVDYTVFVHVPAEGGIVTGDAQPVGGNYPTSAWQPGDRITDVHLLPAVVDLRIPQASIGLYRLDTGERLPIDGTNETEFVISNH